LLVVVALVTGPDLNLHFSGLVTVGEIDALGVILGPSDGTISIHGPLLVSIPFVAFPDLEFGAICEIDYVR
jgi:hypothetical protein